jgi:dUTP pyrophosphatase
METIMNASPLPIEFRVISPMLREFGLPKYESKGAAAIDICALIDADHIDLAPGESYPFKAGFEFHIGVPGVAAIVLPRSGWGSKGLNLKNTIGLIDSDYQGEITCHAVNTNPAGTTPLRIERGKRIFQIVFLPIVQVKLDIIEGAFSQGSDRGKGGFGSTGA